MTIFVMHIKRQHCIGCGADEQLSSLYVAMEVPRPGKSQTLVPCSSIGPADAVHKVNLPLSNTPVCDKCVNDDVARIGRDLYVRWAETLQRKYAPAPASSAGARTVPKPPPTLEDLA